MNGRSDIEEIRAGMDAYQAFTTNTAGKYEKAPLIQGMKWDGPGNESLPLDARQILKLGYLIGKLNGEAGEVSEAFWKFIRDTEEVDTRGPVLLESEEVRSSLVAEVGDVLWYVAQIARVLDTSLGDVAAGNLRKLRDRASRGMLGGSGDNR
jgi:NTP pyrophosphatase (non-canonical NTP hydrolase)